MRTTIQDQACLATGSSCSLPRQLSHITSCRVRFLTDDTDALLTIAILPAGFLITSLAYFSWVCWIAPSKCQDMGGDRACSCDSQTTLSSTSCSASTLGSAWGSSHSTGTKSFGSEIHCSRPGGHRSTSASASCCVTGWRLPSCTTRT